MNAAPVAPGLRERKKMRTRRAIHRAAMELLLREGESKVTVEEIAARADISVRTFFNYYPTKDDAIVGAGPDAHDRFAVWVREQPADLEPAAAVRDVLLEHATQLAADKEMWQLRRRIAEEHPVYWGRMLGASSRLDHALVSSALAREGLTGADALPTSVRVHAVVGAYRAAVRCYAEASFDGTLLEHVSRAFELLPADLAVNAPGGRTRHE